MTSFRRQRPPSAQAFLLLRAPKVGLPAAAAFARTAVRYVTRCRTRGSTTHGASVTQSILVAAVLLMSIACSSCKSAPAAEPASPSNDPSQPAPEPAAPVAQEPVPAPVGSPSAAPSPTGSVVVSSDPCTSDADCVPMDCCHATACGAKAKAPSCDNKMCTMDCRPNTMDCGGSCLCHAGHCAARLAQPGM
jgi:hypothetical protein